MDEKERNELIERRTALQNALLAHDILLAGFPELVKPVDFKIESLGLVINRIEKTLIVEKRNLEVAISQLKKDIDGIDQAIGDEGVPE